jgi:Na+/citrate or Na+/malate symporter
MSTTHLDTIREGVLTRMERADRMMRLAIFAGAAVELVLFAIAIYMVDWHNRVETLLFVFSVLSYTIIVLGMVALAAHVSRCVGRVLAAMDPAPAP